MILHPHRDMEIIRWDQVHSCPLALRTGIARLRSKSKTSSRKSAQNAITERIKNEKPMKRKRLFLAIAVLLAAAGLWLARSAWRRGHSAFHTSNTNAEFRIPSDRLQSGQMLNSTNPGRTLAPPNPSRRFREFTPEQRVEFARKGHGPGG